MKLNITKMHGQQHIKICISTGCFTMKDIPSAGLNWQVSISSLSIWGLSINRKLLFRTLDNKPSPATNYS